LPKRIFHTASGTLDATFFPDCNRKEDNPQTLTTGVAETPGPGTGPGFHHHLMHRSRIMQIQVSGHQIEVTSALRDYVSTRQERLARRFDHLTSLNVVLEVEKNPQAHRAEGTLAAAGKVLHADAVDPDMYAAIDALFDKLDAQVRRHKEKRRAHGREGIRDLA
jgi:ribosome hibernation promoting factor